MQLERATVVLRPRSAWEAMDLGFMLARQHFWLLWILWCATALPVFILTHIVLGSDNLIIAILLFWWLKPLYEPLMSEWLGHALFDDQPTPSAQLQKVHRIAPRGLIGNLTWRRLSLSRSFNMPVHQLEQLKGEHYSKRLKVLQSTNPRSGWLTILCVHLEMALQLSVPVLMLMLVPAEIDFSAEHLFLRESDLFINLLNNLSYFAVASIIAPFYVAAGFALYINARTQLEAWDIEIAFRNIALTTNEKQKRESASRIAAVAVAVAILFSTALPEPVMALDQESAKSTITKVLEDESFGKEEEVTRWKLKNSDEINPVDLPSFEKFSIIAETIKIVAWLAMGTLAVWLLVIIATNLDQFKLRKKGRIRQQSPSLRILDNETTDEPVPEYPVDAALSLCEQQRYREAMSLLYRSTLLNYLVQHQINIPYSATENECLAIVRAKRALDEADYFSTLTHYWQRLAWADSTPSAEKIRELCNQWPLYFSEVHHES